MDRKQPQNHLKMLQNFKKLSKKELFGNVKILFFPQDGVSFIDERHKI